MQLRRKRRSAGIQRKNASIEFLKGRLEEYLSSFDEDFGKEEIYGEYTENSPALNTFIVPDKPGSEKESLILLKVPAKQPWEVFAWLPFGGWNECPDTEDMMAVCRYWYEEYGAIPAVITHDELQMYVTSPPDTQEKALSLAEEHYAFCNDAVDQGAGSIKALAGLLQDSAVWYFWWD